MRSSELWCEVRSSEFWCEVRSSVRSAEFGAKCGAGFGFGVGGFGIGAEFLVELRT